MEINKFLSVHQFKNSGFLPDFSGSLHKWLFPCFHINLFKSWHTYFKIRRYCLNLLAEESYRCSKIVFTCKVFRTFFYQNWRIFADWSKKCTFKLKATVHDQNEKEGYHFSKILKILPAFEEFKRKLRSFGFQINLIVGIEDDNEKSKYWELLFSIHQSILDKIKTNFQLTIT